MKALVVLAALAAVGCVDSPQPKNFTVGQDIAFPAIVAKDAKGRRYAICEFAQRLVRESKLETAAGAKFPSCIDNQAQVQEAAGDGRYTIRSWVDIGPVRREYSGDATIAVEDGTPRWVRITRLDLGGAQ